jgi:hypothetical protein
LPYDVDVPILPARWTELRAGLIALDIPAQAIDNWKTNHPDATPMDFSRAFKNFLN